MNFKEFLKKKKFIPETEKYTAEGMYSSGRGASIEIKDLGDFVKLEIVRLEEENKDVELRDGIDLAYNEGVIQYLKKWLQELK